MPTSAHAQEAAEKAAKEAFLEERRQYFEQGRAYYEAVKRELEAADPALSMTPPPPRSGVLPLPVLFYGPETELGFGAFGMYYFHFGDPKESRTSIVRSSITATTKKQVFFDIGPDFWLANDLVHAGFTFSYQYFPNSFYGIGYRTPPSAREDYTERSYIGLLNTQVRVASILYAGLRARIDDRDIVDRVAGRELASGRVRGSGGGAVIGGGPAITLDSRDNVSSASRGIFAELAVGYYPEHVGDFELLQGRLDLRHYTSFGRKVLAFQMVGEAAAGDAPFYLMPQLGGRFAFRGIYYGRYRDNLMLEGQGEFRFPIFWRFGGVAFLGTGEVAHTASELRLKALYVAGGGGLRFAVVPEERINIRLDFAYGPEGLQYYLELGEAF